eukprot:5974568-Prymnesium_polylepis.1
MCDATLKRAMALGCKQRFEEKTDFFLLTDLPSAILHGVQLEMQMGSQSTRDGGASRSISGKPGRATDTYSLRLRQGLARVQ